MKDRKPYDLLDNNCATFCTRTLKYGGKHRSLPQSRVDQPTSYIEALQEHFGNKISCDPKTKAAKQEKVE